MTGQPDGGSSALDDTLVSAGTAGASEAAPIDPAAPGAADPTVLAGMDTIVATTAGRVAARTEGAMQRAGRFEIREAIGRGGMGVVYRAHDPELDREVAVKVVADSANADLAVRARMIREARAMAKIMHPNVVVVYEVGEQDDQLFIAMELVAGRSLRQWLAETPRSLHEIVDAFVGTAQGLIAAHDVGLVHRDFKPDNVLVGDDGRPRVLDFGLARPSGEAQTRRSESDTDAGSVVVTVAGALAGTPAYMAPEQLEGRATDARTDQFAFAVTLFEALSGARPFVGDDLRSLRASVLSDRVPELKSSRFRIPAPLRAAIHRALSRDPSERHGSRSHLEVGRPGRAAVATGTAAGVEEP